MTEVRTVHDYSAVDAALAAERKAALERVRFVRAAALRGYGRFLLLASAAVSLLILAVAFAWWLLDPEGVYDVPDTAVTESSRDYSESVRRISEAVPETRSDQIISTSFTVFRTVDLEGESSVVTGWTFEPFDLEVPRSQYCYWTARREDYTSDVVELGARQANQDLIWYPVDQRYAGMDELCQWWAASRVSGT